MQDAFDLDILQVIFDPVAVMRQGSPGEVRSAVLDCQVKGGDRYFSAVGCEIPEGTPEENLRAQGETLSEIASPRKEHRGSPCIETGVNQ